MRRTSLTILATAITLVLAARASADEPLLSGRAAMGDWHDDHPGVRRLITKDDLPAPFATRSAASSADESRAPRGASPKVPPGFTAQLFATGLEGPRLIRVAPNGDLFVAETSAGRIKVLRAADGATHPDKTGIFAADLDGPFGIAFYPPGPNPKWVYVATNNSIVRFPYSAGDLAARGGAETIVPSLAGTTNGHSTRDIHFDRDGTRMFVSVGSGSNIGQEMDAKSPAAARLWQQTHALGAAWDQEKDRADVLVFDPEGRNRRVFAAGIRNCVSLAAQPTADDLWCATNERDMLGDDLVPDYVTRVKEGGFYGWPWFYIGGHEDPRLRGQRPDLADKVTVPDVLLQSHSAPLGITFYAKSEGAAAFPAAYDGDAFVALHGSWNRAKRTGYKVVRIRLKGGVPTGEYQDFLTGFVTDDASVWGRPVGVAEAHDGALLVSEDANGTIWRIAHVGTHAAE